MLILRRLMSVSGSVGSCGPLVTAREPVKASLTLSTVNPGSVEGIFSLTAKLTANSGLETYFDTIKQRSLQSRKALGSLFEWLSKYDQVPEGPALSLIINGTNGSGKSAILLQAADILHRTKGDQNLVLYHGQTSRFTLGYYPYYPLSTEENCFEQPELGADLMKSLVEQNPTAKDLHIKDQPLGSLHEQCIKNPLDGHKIFLTVLNHLRQHESVKCHLLLDNVNCLFGPTQYKNQDGSVVTIKQLPLLRSLQECFLRPTRSITAIGAVTHSDPLLGKNHQIQPNPSICNMFVPEMSKQEAQILLQFLHEIGYISPTTSVDRVFVEHKHFMTGGNARLLFESAMYDDIYN